MDLKGHCFDLTALTMSWFCQNGNMWWFYKVLFHMVSSRYMLYVTWWCTCDSVCPLYWSPPVSSSPLTGNYSIQSLHWWCEHQSRVPSAWSKKYTNQADKEFRCCDLELILAEVEKQCRGHQSPLCYSSQPNWRSSSAAAIGLLLVSLRLHWISPTSIWLTTEFFALSITSV